MALLADEERRMVSKRTKDALKAAEARGEVRGGLREAVGEGKLSVAERANVLREATRVSLRVRYERASARAADLAPILAELQAQGVTGLHALARALTERCIPTARGGKVWQAVQVARVLERASQ